VRYLTLNVSDDVTIEIDNSMTGKETIMYNGEVVSEISTVLGGIHRFEKMENGELAKYEVRISIKPILRVGFDIFRNNKVLLIC